MSKEVEDAIATREKAKKPTRKSKPKVETPE